jgi:hypothetical protein
VGPLASKYRQFIVTNRVHWLQFPGKDAAMYSIKEEAKHKQPNEVGTSVSLDLLQCSFWIWTFASLCTPTRSRTSSAASMSDKLAISNTESLMPRCVGLGLCC